MTFIYLLLLLNSSLILQVIAIDDEIPESFKNKLDIIFAKDGDPMDVKYLIKLARDTIDEAETLNQLQKYMLSDELEELMHLESMIYIRSCKESSLERFIEDMETLNKGYTHIEALIGLRKTHMIKTCFERIVLSLEQYKYIGDNHEQWLNLLRFLDQPEPVFKLLAKNDEANSIILEAFGKLLDSNESLSKKADESWYDYIIRADIKIDESQSDICGHKNHDQTRPLNMELVKKLAKLDPELRYIEKFDHILLDNLDRAAFCSFSERSIDDELKRYIARHYSSSQIYDLLFHNDTENMNPIVFDLLINVLSNFQYFSNEEPTRDLIRRVRVAQMVKIEHSKPGYEISPNQVALSARNSMIDNISINVYFDYYFPHLLKQQTKMIDNIETFDDSFREKIFIELVETILNGSNSRQDELNITDNELKRRVAQFLYKNGANLGRARRLKRKHLNRMELPFRLLRYICSDAIRSLAKKALAFKRLLNVLPTTYKGYIWDIISEKTALQMMGREFCDRIEQDLVPTEMEGANELLRGQKYPRGSIFKELVKLSKGAR